MNKIDIFPTTIFQFQLEDKNLLDASYKVVDQLKMTLSLIHI